MSRPRKGELMQGRMRDALESRRSRLGLGVIGMVVAAVVIAVALPAGAGANKRAFQDVHRTKAFWHKASLKRALERRGARPALRLRAKHDRSFTLNRSALRKVLAAAPRERTHGARLHPVVVSLPVPNGRFQRFALARSAIMAPGLARKHPEIRTYSGRGIDDPAATIHADLSPIGFHASVRSPEGAWYIDPYLRNNAGTYVSYYGRQLEGGYAFAERDPEGDQGSDEQSDAPTSDPPTGDVLRTYRLALITDPGYAAYHGGPANVTAAKVALMNRVDQVYEDDLSIRMQLIANNDLLNLNTWDAATAPNGPCGAAACFTQSQVTGCSSTSRARFVIGQIIGASNYDIGHLALGQPGGGVANLGVVGRSNKAGGCTGIPTPTGDFYAIDYVAHEMGHQFAGNHPFNGNQLNCSGGNRSAANSDEPGSGSSIMAYAGICLTDDLQRHSDPYFSQHSQQEISTYTSSDQAAINEVQTASLRHFGGGNEVQTVTFGPGYSQAATVQPLSLAINASPSATSRGGAEENGNTVTIATGAVNTLQVGDTVTVAGVGEAGYNGTWTVTAVPTTRSFQYTNPTAGLPVSGGGTVTLAAPGLSETGNSVLVRTAAAHNRSVGDVVTITNAGIAGYNGTFTVDSVPTPRSFTYTSPTAGLATSGGGTVTFFSQFQVRIGGSDSVVVGGSGLPYNAANLSTAINAIPGFAGTATVTSAASTGFTVAYSGASANVDVPNLELVNLSCGGCFASVEETNHGGDADSFTIGYGGNVSAPITNGVNYTAAGIAAALTPILPAGATLTVAGFGNGAFSNTGFQVTFAGTLAQTNVPQLLTLQDFSAGASGFVGETDKGGPVDNKGGTITPTGDHIPSVTAPVQYTIPLRTPFALTGSGADADGDALVYSWEQNDRGASPNSAGTSLLSNTKTNGPLFAMFPKSGQISDADSLLYDSPGENHLTGDPTRVFPDLQQILDNNTNADTGTCPPGPIAQPVPQASTECYSEFLPTSDYVGVDGVNANPLSLHFRLTARDGRGGTSSADTTLLLASGTGPFLVTSPNTAVSLPGESTQTITWDPAGTADAPVSTSDVKISLSVDDGHTYPYVLADSTPNDGSADVVLPMVGTTHARVKVEAVGNIFFDVSNADFAITWPFTGFFPPIANPPALNSAAAGSSIPVKFSLGGDRGLDILADGYPVSAPINCATGAATGPPVPTSSDLGLVFESGQYKYVWKTNRSWTGTCRELRVLLVDGTLHTAKFRFK